MRVAVVTVALSLAPALAAPQSLGDAARKQARERSKQTPPSRVYTEADLHVKGDTPVCAPPVRPASSTRAEAHAGTANPAVKEMSEDAVRAQLDREAEARKERERAGRAGGPGRRSHGWRRRRLATTLSAAPALSCEPGADPRRHAPGFWPRKARSA